ncbi:MAG: hypothetical protein V4760_14780 [Bdellovibrionota bacterium]
MFKATLLVVLGLLAGSVTAGAATGFETGNEFQSVELRGELSVTCPGRMGGYITAYYRCAGETLDPVEFARFRPETPVDADAVELKALHADGSSRTKSGGYSSSKSRSDYFNLWILTLTQRPLLEMGVNTVGYKMKKKGAIVAEGTFTATVKDGGRRECEFERYHSQNPADCENGDNVCQYDFEQQNYCQR